MQDPLMCHTDTGAAATARPLKLQPSASSSQIDLARENNLLRDRLIMLENERLCWTLDGIPTLPRQHGVQWECDVVYPRSSEMKKDGTDVAEEVKTQPVAVSGVTSSGQQIRGDVVTTTDTNQSDAQIPQGKSTEPPPTCRQQAEVDNALGIPETAARTSDLSIAEQAAAHGLTTRQSKRALNNAKKTAKKEEAVELCQQLLRLGLSKLQVDKAMLRAEAKARLTRASGSNEEGVRVEPTEKQLNKAMIKDGRLARKKARKQAKEQAPAQNSNPTSTAMIQLKSKPEA